MDENNRIEIEQEKIDQARTLGERLKSEMSKRNTLFEAMEKIYKMDWDLPSDGTLAADDVKKTVSPDGRNAVNGGVRLMTTTEPVWRITVRGKEGNSGDELEDAAKMIWNRSGMNRRKPPHHDMLLSMLLYDECHVAISSIAEYAKLLKGKPKHQARAEAAAKKAPFSVEVWNPKEGYPYFDTLGLAGYYRCVTMSTVKAQEIYGPVVTSILAEGKKEKDETIQLDLWYDLEKCVVWVNGQVVVAEAWELPFLPIDVTICEGSSLFVESDENRNPLLYSVNKSSFWEHENLALTVMYTNVRRYGLNPLYVHREGVNSDGRKPHFDYARGVITVPHGDEFSGVRDKQAIDPALVDVLQLAEKKVEESSIYRTALGQNLGSSAPFSSVALLTQSGRLPLAAPKKMGAQAIASVMEICLNWYRELKQDCPGIGLKPNDVPEQFEISVNLEVDLPQDKLQQANIATMLTREGIVDMDWTRENVLQITNGPEMEERIWSEKAARAMYEQMLQQVLYQEQAPPQGQPPQGMPPQGGAPQGVPAQMMNGVGGVTPADLQEQAGNERQAPQMPMPPMNGRGDQTGGRR